jgi:hypothetical protein
MVAMTVDENVCNPRFAAIIRSPRFSIPTEIIALLDFKVNISDMGERLHVLRGFTSEASLLELHRPRRDRRIASVVNIQRGENESDGNLFS